LNRNLIFVALALFTWGIGEGMFFNFQPVYLAELGSDPQQIGLILGAFGAAMAITHIPAGHLADRFGRRPLLLIAWGMGLLAAVVMALATSLELFVVGMLIYGLTAFVSSPLASYVTAARGKWSVGLALALTSATFNLGMVLGPFPAGWIGEHYGLRTVYFFAVGLFAVSNILLFFIPGQPLDRHDPNAPPVSVLSNKHFIAFLGVMALAGFAMYLAQPLTPNFLRDVRGLKLDQMGLIFMVGAAGNALVSAFFGLFKPQIGYPLTQALVGLFALLIWRSTEMPYFILGYFLLGGFRAARPLTSAQARALVHESQMGLTFGIMETVNAAIFIITPPLAGFLFERSPSLVYPLSLGLISVSIVVTLIFAPRPADTQPVTIPAD
jgi:MFS family permease